MSYEFKLPDLGEGLTEGEVARWLVAEGDEIAEDQPLVEIQTDKTTVEIPSPAAGTVTSIRVAEGDVVPVGTVLVVIGGDGGRAGRGRSGRDPGSDPGRVCTGTRPVGRVQATPLVRRLAQELGVALESVTPTGPAGGSPRTTCGPRRAPTEGRRETGARRPAADRRAPDARAPGGAGGHLRRGVRLLERRPAAAPADRAPGDRALAAATSPS